MAYRTARREVETVKGKKKLIRAISRNMLNYFLARAHRLPRDWDGHELREWMLIKYTEERTHLMEQDAKRRRKCRNAVLVGNL